jgi:HAD superfamily hydrolase (TIGR01549 family)
VPIKDLPNVIEGIRSGGLAVVFDFHNTLVTLKSGQPTLAEALSTMGFECSDEFERLFSSDSFDGEQTPKGGSYMAWRRELLTELCRAVSVPPQQIGEIVDQLLGYSAGWSVAGLAGVSELLELFNNRSVKYGIASNWDFDLRPYLIQAGLSPDITYVVSCDVGWRKPSPELLLEACRMLHNEPESTIYVGDMWDIDVAGALRANMIPLWIRGADRDRPPVASVESIEELLNRLRD